MGGRYPRDSYQTPPVIFYKFASVYFRDRSFHSILEPAAGKGNIVSELRRFYPDARIDAVEIDKGFLGELAPKADKVFLMDFLKWQPERFYDLIVTNPPFCLALEFLDKALSLRAGSRVPVSVVMLLRLGFLASQKRKMWWQDHPPTGVYVCSERPCFTGSADNADYAWFVWDSEPLRICWV